MTQCFLPRDSKIPTSIYRHCPSSTWRFITNPVGGQTINHGHSWSLSTSHLDSPIQVEAFQPPWSPSDSLDFFTTQLDDPLQSSGAEPCHSIPLSNQPSVHRKGYLYIVCTVYTKCIRSVYYHYAHGTRVAQHGWVTHLGHGSNGCNKADPNSMKHKLP